MFNEIEHIWLENQNTYRGKQELNLSLQNNLKKEHIYVVSVNPEGKTRANVWNSKITGMILI
jgi:hypothetical protein